MAQKEKKKRRTSAASRERQSEAKASRRQVKAVLLLGLAVLLMCFAVIPGGSLWGVLHDFVWGMAGYCCLAIPVVLGYIAVILSMEKTHSKACVVAWECGLLLMMGCSFIEICEKSAKGIGFFGALGRAYVDAPRSGGFIGALLGYPMERLFDDIGAKIITALLIGVSLMLITGTTVAALAKAVMKPVKKTGNTLKSMITERRNKKIDVPLDTGTVEKIPAELMEDNTPTAVLPKVEEEEEIEDAAERLSAFTKAAQEMKAENARPAPKVDDLLAKNARKPEPIEAEEEPETKAEEIKEEAAKEAKKETADEADGYRYPPVYLLDQAPAADDAQASEEIQRNADLLVKTLKDFGISSRIIHVSRGPSVTRYELEPSAGVKLSRITGLADDLAMRLATTGVRIEAPIPNKAAVGIEVPNRISSPVCLRELIDSPEFSAAQSRLTVALGKDITGNIVLADLSKMPHLLIAGTTGSGKSVCTNSMIQSVLYRSSPSEVRLLLIDPKQVEFGVYNGIPHLLVPVVTDPRKAAGALGWAVTEMLGRYKMFADNNVRDLAGYNELAKKSDTLHPLPQILIVIDELADLMMAAASEVEDSIIRLAQMARAAGMHLVIATQRPSVDVITGLIKANIPSRLALTVASAVDSRTILDTGGAEKLLGRGDMLFMPVGMSKPIRVQGCFVSSKEVEAVVKHLKSAQESEYDEAVIQEIDRQAAAAGGNKGRASVADDDGDDSQSDEMLPQAIEVVVEAGMASTSLLQRKLRLGYARAGRIIDEMEQRGIVGPHEGSKPRQVLITRQQWLEMNMRQGDEE